MLRDELTKVTIQYTIFFFLRPFPYLGSAHRVFNLHVLWSCGSSIFTWFSFMSFLITSLHLSSFGLPILRCPPTSMFSFLQSSSAFLSTRRNHLSLASLIFSLVFATLALISSFLDLPNPLYSHHNTQYAIQSNLFQLPYMSMISIHWMINLKWRIGILSWKGYVRSWLYKLIRDIPTSALHFWRSRSTCGLKRIQLVYSNYVMNIVLKKISWIQIQYLINQCVMFHE